MMKKTLLPILLATVWISLNEFVRNELVLKTSWVGHYEQLGIIFPSEPINGALWGGWSLIMATVFFALSKNFSLWESFAVGWLAGYAAMWVVVGNLGVLPMDILPVAISWSLVEAFGAVYVIRKFK